LSYFSRNKLAKNRLSSPFKGGLAESNLNPNPIICLSLCYGLETAEINKISEAILFWDRDND